MIYNLVNYLRTQFPTETIYCNAELNTGTQEFPPDRCVIVKETGGPNQAFTLWVSPTFQIITRDKDIVNGKELTNNIFNDINDKSGLLLPAVTVNSIVYAEVEIGLIKAIQEPYYLGEDEQGRHKWTTNFKVIYKRG